MIRVGGIASRNARGRFFGPDCSKRRCPSRDPLTEADETDCENVNGVAGNLCHVHCLRREYVINR